MIPDYLHMYICHPFPFLKIYFSCMTRLCRERIWQTWGGILQSVTMATSSHLPRLTFCSMSSGTWQSLNPKTLKWIQRVHSTLSKLDIASPGCPSQRLYERSKNSSNGQIFGNLWRGMGL